MINYSFKPGDLVFYYAVATLDPRNNKPTFLISEWENGFVGLIDGKRHYINKNCLWRSQYINNKIVYN